MAKTPLRLKDLRIDPSLKEKVPAKVVYHYKFMPLSIEGNTLRIAVSDPTDIQALDDIKMVMGYNVEPIFAEPHEIEESLKQHYGIGADTVEKISASDTLIKALDLQESAQKDLLEESAEEASMIGFVNQLLMQAVKDRATDIHIEPFEETLRVRYRIDGVLHEKPIPPNTRQYHSSLVSRIKIMANLNIAEHRLPQDGRIKIKMGDQDLDLRVSILPTAFGETVDIRILSSENVVLGLPHLGLNERDTKIIDGLLKKTHGVILVTGPTGSGKSTTLYAALSKLNTPDRKIITIEDPVEYQLKGITQLQVLPKIDFTFARGLRSILRHDPNVIMVGEIRDFETAEITIRCALTGHLVFSTLHTNDAAGGITRLIDMGVEPFLVASAVECLIAQRLVRVICPHCRKAVTPELELLKELGIPQPNEKISLFEGTGCENCSFTGYHGRTAIYEILAMTDTIREMVVQRQSAYVIKKKALQEGMVSLRLLGWEKVKQGKTTLSEVLRVTQEESQVE